MIERRIERVYRMNRQLRYSVANYQYDKHTDRVGTEGQRAILTGQAVRILVVFLLFLLFSFALLFYF